MEATDIPAETLAAFLDDAWDAVKLNGNLLRDQLRSFEKSITIIFSQGSLTSVSKNSASQTYRGPGLGSYTPGQLQTAWRRLINLYDQTLAQVNWMIAHPSTCYPAPVDNSDATVYPLMAAQLTPVSTYQVDVTDLRLWPTAAQGPNPAAW